MDIQLKDGRTLQFPEGTSDEVALGYIKENYPDEPNIVERVAGHLAMGAGRAIQKVSNVAGYDPSVSEATTQGIQSIKEIFTESQPARQVVAHPETSTLGQVGAELVEFLPQLPIYYAGERLGLRGLSAIPKVSKVVPFLKAVKGEGYVKDTARAVGRAAIAGATVGTIAGTPAETPIGEKLIEGGKEAVGFAAAVTVLHPVFRVLGVVGRGIYRRLGRKATPENVEAELSKKAETDPAAAEELQRFREAQAEVAEKPAEAEELFVPKGEDVVTEAAEPKAEFEFTSKRGNKYYKTGDTWYDSEGVEVKNRFKIISAEKGKKVGVQEELNLDPVRVEELGAEPLAKLRELEYSDADLNGMSYKQAEAIYEQGIKKSPTVAEIPKVEEVISDTKVEEGLQGRKRRRKEPIAGEPIEGAGGEEVEAGRDVQALEGEAAKEAKVVGDLPKRGVAVAVIGPDGTLYVGPKNVNHSMIADHYNILNEPNIKDGFVDRKGNFLTAEEAAKAIGKEGVLTAEDLSPKGIGKGMVEAPYGKKITKAPSDVLELQRMDYTKAEIQKMSGEEARATIERIKNIPEPTAEEIARAEAAGAKVQEAFLAREAEKGKVTTDAEAGIEAPKMTKEQRAQNLTELEKEIAEIETTSELPTSAIETLLKAQRTFEDPTLDSLVEKMPKSREEIMEVFRQRARALAAKVEPIKKVKTDAELAADQKKIDDLEDKIDALDNNIENAKTDVARERMEKRKVALEDELQALEIASKPLGVGQKEMSAAEVYDYQERNNLLPWQRDTAVKKKPPQTQEELDKHLAGVRAKARRGRKTVDYAKEAEDWEAKLKKEGMEAEPIPEGEETTLYSNPVEPIYNWLKKLIASEKIKRDAPSNKLVSEISGSTLTMRAGSEMTDTSLKQIFDNIGKFVQTKLQTPGFAWRGHPFRPKEGPGFKETADLTFQLHKGLYEGRGKASDKAATVIASRSLLTSVEIEKQVKPHIEGTKISTDPRIIEAARMLKEEYAATNEDIKTAKREAIKDNVNEDEWAAVSEILALPETLTKEQRASAEAGIFAKYKTHIVREGKLQKRMTRDWVNEDVVRDIIKEYKEVDNWGIKDYSTHFEFGSMKIVSGGKLYARAVSIKDASRKHIGLVKRDKAEGISRDYQIDTSVNLEHLATGLDKRSYNRAVINLQKGIKKAIDGINDATSRRLAQKGLKDRYYIKPTNKYSPYFETREDLLQGEENIYDSVFHYFYSVHTKLALDPKIKAVRDTISKTDVVGTEQYKAKDGTMKTRDVKRPHLSNEQIEFLQTYIEDIKGRYYPGDKIADKLLAGTGYKRMYSKSIQVARELQANLKLSYGPAKGAINGASAMGYLWTAAGAKNIKLAMEFMRTPEGKAFTAGTDKYVGMTLTEGATGELSNRGFFERIGWLRPPATELGKLGHAAIEPLGWFQLPELPMRRLTIATGYIMGKASGLSDAAARDVAIEFNHFCMFTYDTASLPELMRGPTGKLVTQFKPFMMKSIEFMSKLRGVEIARFTAMQLALAGPRGFLILVKSLPVLYVTGALDKLEEWMNKEYPRLSRGLPGFLGVDVSVPATFELPTKARDWYGPTIANLLSLNSNVFVPLLEGKGVDGSDLSKFMGDTFPIYRYWAKIVEQVVDKDGWVKDERNRRLYHIDNTAAFVTKNVLGAQDLEESRIRVAERILTKRKFDIGDQKIDTIDSILDAIGRGKAIDPADLENMMRLGIKSGSFRRNKLYRNLTPMQRRLLDTEIIRRPEILKMYPDIAD